MQGCDLSVIGGPKLAPMTFGSSLPVISEEKMAREKQREPEISEQMRRDIEASRESFRATHEDGTRGICWKTADFEKKDSEDYGVWLFKPDYQGSDIWYCEREQLKIEPTPVRHWPNPETPRKILDEAFRETEFDGAEVLPLRSPDAVTPRDVLKRELLEREKFGDNVVDRMNDLEAQIEREISDKRKGLDR
jgi:hypothetical protein